MKMSNIYRKYGKYILKTCYIISVKRNKKIEVRIIQGSEQYTEK